MFAAALDASYHRSRTKGGLVASWFLKQLNMRTLACAMFVALALLSNTASKDAGPESSALRRPIARDFGNKIKLESVKKG
jgi:hypothetical protein